MSTAGPSPVPLERLLWTAGVIIGASLPHWPSLPVWVPALLGACILWRLSAKLKGWPLPNRLARIMLALAAFSGVLAFYGTINGLDAGSALLVVMIALKFLETHTHRDQIVLVIIAYFLVFASLLYDRGFFAALYLLGFVWLTTVGLLKLGQHGALLPSLQSAKLAARFLLQAVPIMLILFLLFPRLPGPIWAIPGDEDSGTTGLSDSMSPGDITTLGISDEVAFRVEFLTNPPKAEELYWRGPILSEFNGRTWTRTPGMRRRVINTLVHNGEPSEYRVTLEPGRRNWLFAIDMPKSWAAVGRQNIVMGSDYQLRVFSAEPIDARIDYDVTSYPSYVAREALTPNEIAVFTRLPEDSNPRTRALVAGWRADGLTPEQVMARGLDMFRAEEFYYSLTPPPLGRHTADEFIFETREGFCEHYASAFAIMMRAAGLPTRIVTGYQGGEHNRLGDYYIVYQSQAHAWTEVWLGDRGWVRVDPTAAVAPERISLGSIRGAFGRTMTRGEALTQMRWVRQILLAYDAANTYWSRWVLGYGSQLQHSLLQRLGFERLRWSELMTLAILCTVAVLGVLTVYLSFTFHRQRHTDAAQRAFAAFVRKLSPARVAPLAIGEAPRAYARRAELALPHAAADIEHIAESYLAARYEPDGRAALENLERLVKAFRLSPART